LEAVQKADLKIFISEQIRQREFGKSIPVQDLPVLARSCRLALATPIAGKGLPVGTRLLKSYATSPSGPKRVIYLLVVDDGDVFLLFYRGKNDAIGNNTSMANPAFKASLAKHLALLEEDIRAGQIESLDFPE